MLLLLLLYVWSFVFITYYYVTIHYMRECVTVLHSLSACCLGWFASMVVER